MDGIMEKHAVPSKTALANRGWVTDPSELKEYYDFCDRENLTILGTYHMHIVPWEHDPVRDTPTRLDGILAKNSGFLSFIVSMVDIRAPRIRAFYEGLAESEIPIQLEEERQAGIA
jgi:hypothetical protein